MSTFRYGAKALWVLWVPWQNTHVAGQQRQSLTISIWMGHPCLQLQWTCPRPLILLGGMSCLILCWGGNFSPSYWGSWCTSTIFTHQHYDVKWWEQHSCRFAVTNGVRQGAVSSAISFVLYINELLALLKNSGLGCHIHGVFFGALVFADDILLLSASRSGLQQKQKGP